MTKRKTMPSELRPDVAAGSEKPAPDHAERPSKAGLGRDIQTKIGVQLRTLYNDIVSEGTPDRFVRLLNELDKKTAKKTEQGSK